MVAFNLSAPKVVLALSRGNFSEEIPFTADAGKGIRSGCSAAGQVYGSICSSAGQL
jgi:hypothetical protein